MEEKMMTAEQWKELDKQYIAGTYARFPIIAEKGEGAVLTDIDGKQYIDLGAGIGVTAFGYLDPEWKKAVLDQLDKIQHTSNLYYTQPCITLAKMLCERTGMSKVFFSNSGAEANECAIKAARKYAVQKKQREFSRQDPDNACGDRTGPLPRAVPTADNRFCTW